MFGLGAMISGWVQKQFGPPPESEREKYARLYAWIKERRERLHDLPISSDPFIRDNPDSVVRRKGYEPYDRMLSNPIISSCTEIALVGMLPDWNIYPGTRGDRAQAQKAADMVEDNLMRLPGSPMDVLHEELMSPAFRMGFVLAEAIWDVSQRTGEARWADILHRPHSTCKFVYNEHGRTIGAVQHWNGEYYRFPEMRTVHLCYRGGRRNPYGLSGYYQIYDSWQDILDIEMAYAVFLRRHGAGMATAKVPKTKWENETEMELLLEILDNAQGTDRLILPDYVDLKFENTASGAGGVYAKAKAAKLMEITRGILGPDTAVAEALRVGARADTAGKTETMWTILHSRGRKLREQIEEQWFRPLVQWNLPGAPVPKLGTNTASSLAVQDKLQAWGQALTSGVLPAPTIEQQAQMLEEMGVDFDEKMAITEKQAPSLAGDGTRASDTALNGARVSAALEIVRQVVAGELTEEMAENMLMRFFGISLEDAQGMLEGHEEAKVREEPQAITAASATQKKRYLKQRKERFEYEDEATEQVVKLYKDTVGDAFDNILTIAFPNGELRTSEKVKQPTGEFKEVPVSASTLRDRLKITNKDKIAAELFDVSWKAREMGKEHAESNIQMQMVTSRIGKAISDTTARDLLRNEIFYTIQQTYGGLEQDIWHEIANVISGDQITERAINNIRMILYENLYTDPRGGVTTLVRTNVGNAYVGGRDRVYARHETLDTETTDPGKIIGYELYATLDGKTTEGCRKIHGFCIKVGDPDMRLAKPLRHFNCRLGRFPIFGGEKPPAGHWLTEGERRILRNNPPAKGFGGIRESA
jgi:hypothetical protein